MTKTLLHTNPWFKVVHHKSGLQDWYRVEAPDSAIVVGSTKEGDFLLVRGTRGGADALAGYEFPGGLVAPGEDPSSAAVRELAEETGYHAADLSPLGSFYQVAAVSSAQCHVFEATVSPGGNQELEGGEDWEPFLVNKSEFMALLSSSQIRDSSTLSAFALYSVKSG